MLKDYYIRIASRTHSRNYLSDEMLGIARQSELGQIEKSAISLLLKLYWSNRLEKKEAN